MYHRYTLALCRSLKLVKKSSSNYRLFKLSCLELQWLTNKTETTSGIEPTSGAARQMALWFTAVWYVKIRDPIESALRGDIGRSATVASILSLQPAFFSGRTFCGNRVVSNYVSKQ